MKHGVSIHVGDIQTSVGKGEQKANHLHRFWDETNSRLQGQRCVLSIFSSQKWGDKILSSFFAEFDEVITNGPTNRRTDKASYRDANEYQRDNKRKCKRPATEREEESDTERAYRTELDIILA